jgi:hypothetical protein
MRFEHSGTRSRRQALRETGATGLEPATSGVTGHFQDRDMHDGGLPIEPAPGHGWPAIGSIGPVHMLTAAYPKHSAPLDVLPHTVRL